MAKFVPFLVLAAVFGLALARRMRPQPVRPRRLVITAALIVLVLGLTAAGTGAALFKDVPALLLAPVALAVGCGIGLLLVRTTRFWTNEQDGQLWMAGGVVFAVVLMATVILRVGLRVAATSPNGSTPAPPGGFLADVSTDLLLLSLGMWLTRAAMVYQRWRRHQATSATTADQPTTAAAD